MKLVYNSINKNLNRGSMFHYGRELWYNYNGDDQKALDGVMAKFDATPPNTQSGAEILATNRVIVYAMLSGYFDRYRNKDFKSGVNITPEIKFSLPIINPKTGAISRTFNFEGKIDGHRVEDVLNLISKYIMEDKTGGKIDSNYFDRIKIDTQVTGYFYATQKYFNEKLDGVIYRVTRTPGIKQKQKETKEQFRERIILDYKTKQDFYYQEVYINRDDSDMVAFEQELWDKAKDIRNTINKGWWYRDTSRCKDWGGCSYMPLCLAMGNEKDLTEKIRTFYRVVEPNSELRD